MNAQRRVQKPAFSAFLLATQVALCFQLIGAALVYNGLFTTPLVHKFLLAQYLSLFAWLCYAGHCLQTGRFVLAKSPAYLPLGILLLWSLIRALFTEKADAIDNAYIFIAISLSFPLWVTCLRDGWFRRLVVYSLLFIGVAMLLGCLRQLLYQQPQFNWPFFDFITLAQGSTERQSLGSFMGHNIQSGAVLAIAGFFAVYAIITAKALWMRAAAAVYLFLAILIIVIGGSRGVVLMIIPPILYLTAVYRHAISRALTGKRFSLQGWPVKRLAAAAVIGLVLIAITAGILLQQPKAQWESSVFARFVTSPELLVSGTYPRVWLMSLLMITDNPLMGVGFSAWPHQYPYYQEQWFAAHPTTWIGLPEPGTHTLRAHNDFLQPWAELGLPGLFCMFWLLIIFVIALRRLQPQRDTLALFAGGAAMAILTHALVFFTFHIATSAVLFIVAAALLSQRVFPGVHQAHPAFLRRNQPGRSLAIGLPLLLGFVALTQPIATYAAADYLARLFHRYNASAYEAYMRGDYDTWQTHAQAGYNSMLRSVAINPRRGTPLYDLGKESITRGIGNNNPGLAREGIEYLQQSLQSYTFYLTFSEMGRGYAWLWEQTQNDEDLEAAIQNYQQAVDIMPTYEEGWAQLALLQAKAGNTVESIEFISEMELRYPGFVERAILGHALQAEQNGEMLNAMYWMSMASASQPKNPTIFQESVRFYLRQDRIDLGADIFVNTVHFHSGPETIDKTLQLMAEVLWTLLSGGHLNEARLFLQQAAQNEPALQEHADYWMKRGSVAWLAGDHWGAMGCWQMAWRQGAQSAPMQNRLLELRSALLAFF